MKNKILSLMFAALAVVSFTSCDDYFDDVPDNATSLEDVFTNRGQSLQWLRNIYLYIPDDTNLRYDSRANGCWTVACNEGYLPWDHVVANNIILGTLTPSTDLVKTKWTEYYRGIQYANIFLANIDQNKALTDEELAAVKAECRALRAYFYFCLMKVYGPVPIIGDEVFDVADGIDKMSLPRNTVDECFDYIISEMNEALNSGALFSQFDGEGAYADTYTGNITQESLEGILSVVYLFRASYAYNGDSYYQNLANNDGTKLFPQSRDEQKWRDARDAAKRIIDSGKFQLVYRDKTGKKIDAKDACPYNSVYFSYYGSTGNNEEMIFFRPNSSNDVYPLCPRLDGVSSDSHKGAGAEAIPLQFVDLFFTNNGLGIDEDEDYFTYDEENPCSEELNTMCPARPNYYQDPISGYRYFQCVSGKRVMKQYYNREARFYLCVSFQNRPWDYGSSNSPFCMNMNGNSGPDGKTHDYSIFGTCARKPFYSNQSSWNVSIKLRLGEVYLNYAEACAELGELDEAVKYLNIIRSRAGIPEYAFGSIAEGKDSHGLQRIVLKNLKNAANTSGDQDLVRKAIYRERLIELAYESKHYFDVRRWGVADMAQGDGWVYPTWHKGGEGGEMVGYNVNNSGTEEEQANELNFYKRMETQHRVFNKRMTFFPIPQEEVNRDKNIVQNTGWDSETTEE